MQLDGKTVKNISPDAASHTFTVPQMGIVVPIKGVADDAPNQCPEMPCSLDQAHETVTFMIRTGKDGLDSVAMLRAVRGRLLHWLRRADADDRLHGRLPARGLSPSDDARAPPLQTNPDPVGRAQHHRDAHRGPGVGAGSAAGQQHQRGLGTGDGQHGPARDRDADRRADDRLLRLRADRLPPPRRGARGGGRDPRGHAAYRRPGWPSPR